MQSLVTPSWYHGHRRLQGKYKALGKTAAGEHFLLDLAILLTSVVHKNGIILQKGEGKEGSRSQFEIQYSHFK